MRDLQAVPISHSLIHPQILADGIPGQPQFLTDGADRQPFAVIVQCLDLVYHNPLLH